jgi:hypothetical protein
VRHEDDEAAGKRDLGREPRALRLHRVLDRLDEYLLAPADQVGDPAPARPAALELRADDLVDEQEAVLLETDLDERCLHSGKDVVDDALVDVAGDRAALRPLEIDLRHSAVLEDGDALLGDVDGDEQFTLRRGERCATRHLPSATGRAALPIRRVLPVLLRLALLLHGLAQLPLRGRFGAPRWGRGTVLGLAAVPAAAAAATAFRLGGRVARFGLGRGGCGARCFYLGD